MGISCGNQRHKIILVMIIPLIQAGGQHQDRGRIHITPVRMVRNKVVIDGGQALVLCESVGKWR